MTSSNNSLDRFAIATKRQSFLDWIEKASSANALWSFPFGLSCCALEYAATFSGEHFLTNHSNGPVRSRIEDADVLIFSGSVNAKLLPLLLDMYERMREPKWVMAVGACATSGGLYNESQMIWPGLQERLPVDVFVPGCPPAPEVLQQSLLFLQEKMRAGEHRRMMEQTIEST